MAQRLNRRRMLMAGGAAATTTLLRPGARPAAAAPHTLTFWTPHTGIYCDLWDAIASEYRALTPDATFEPIQCGAGEQNFKEALLSRIAAGAPPDVSVIWETPVSYAARGALMPLDEMMASSQYSAVDNWPEGVLASCQFDGQTYGFPTMTGVYGIYYNQDLFEEMGLPIGRDEFPKTWDELRRLSKEFTRWNGDQLETAGFIPDWSMPETFPIWAALNGGRVFDPDNLAYTIDAEPNVAALDYALAWLDEEYNGDFPQVRYDAGWAMALGEQNEPPMFQAQRLAITMDGSWQMVSMYESAEMEFERWDVAQFPYGPGASETTAGYWPNWLVLPAGTDIAQDAFNYVDWINGVGVEDWFNANPDIPSNRTFDRALLPPPVVERRGEEFTESAMDFWYDQLEISTPMWLSPVEDFAVDQIRRALERVFLRAATPQEALAEAQAASQAELERFLQV